MNFLSHAIKFLDDPYFVTGTAIPDWVSLVPGDVRARVRRDAALALVDDENDSIAALGRGIVQHHDDDRWFHSSNAFREMQFERTPGRDRLWGRRLLATSIGALEVVHRQITRFLDGCRGTSGQ